MNIAGIDLGNDSIKIVYEDSREPMIISNIVTTGYDRQILQEEDSPLKALDVMVYSPTLALNNRRWFVGQLATEMADSTELEDMDNKALSDQSLIVALTAIAYTAITNPFFMDTSNAQMDEIELVIGTGLPVRSFAKYRDAFEQRLVGEHEVTFLSTPQLNNRKVKVKIRKAFISIEGAAAVFHLATDDHLQVRNEEIYHGCIGVCEIGALTTDLPVIRKMAIDNHFSSGEQLGLSSYLDSIIREVEDEHGYLFSSRSKLAHRIKQGDYTIRRLGEGQTSIKPIVDLYFQRAAQRIVDLIKKRWKKCPDIQCYYVMGGGASALKSYILQAAGTMKLRFVEQSELQNMYGYLKVAKSRMNQGKYVEMT